MPKVDMVMDTGTLVEWLKDEGDHVEKGEPLFIVLTDKANIEIEAPASGILAGVMAQPDDVIPVTEVIAYILEPGEDLPSESRAPTEAVPSAEAPAVAPQPIFTTVEVESTESELTPSTKKTRATPAARRLAAELGVDLASVSGSGTRGRVHKNDVQAFAEQRQPTIEAKPMLTAPSMDIPLPDAGQKQVVPLAGPRKMARARSSPIVWRIALLVPRISRFR
jgi:pyruvate dehydrogenase E2 component (dihydrolipoamide acetyltransferase)